MSKKNNKMHFGGSFEIYRFPKTVKDFVTSLFVGDVDEDVDIYADRVYITRVLYNGPATIIFWSDGTKTMTKCHDTDHYSAEVGFINAYLKKLVGPEEVYQAIQSWVPKDVSQTDRSITISDVRKFYKENLPY